MWFSQLFKDIKSYFSDGFLLNPNDKDCIMQVLNHGCLELAEVDATFRKTDQSQFKAFITRQHDNLRLPYGRESKKYKRKTLFCATVNDHHFLSDATGSTRFWVITIPKGALIDFNHSINMQQLFAQLYEEYYSKNVSFRPTEQEENLIIDNNQENNIVSPMEELLLQNFSIDKEIQRNERMNVTQILSACGYDYATMSKKHTNEMGNLLRKHNFQMVRKNKKLYAMPGKLSLVYSKY